MLIDLLREREAGEQEGRARMVRDQKRETHMETAGETRGSSSDGMGWRERTALQRRGDLTETYEPRTNSLIMVIHPLISSAKANADPHIYIHLLYIWSPTQAY